MASETKEIAGLTSILPFSVTWGLSHESLIALFTFKPVDFNLYLFFVDNFGILKPLCVSHRFFLSS